MMKSRSVLIVVIFLLVLGIALFNFIAREQEPLQVFPATVNRDCAPWDGAAFTIAVQYDSATTIMISVWRSPNLEIPATFIFPDETGQVGNAYILPELGPYTVLQGMVSLERVGEGMPLEGRFSLTSERGGSFVGKFNAEWQNVTVLCG